MKKSLGRNDRINNKGLSPIIATILLISIALVLALIIFIWARSFVGEKVQKFGSPVENACQQVQFDVDASSVDGTLHVVNRGNVALYGVEVRDQSAGTIESVGTFKHTITTGEDDQITLDTTLTANQQLLIVPMILGETSTATKAFVCDTQYAVQVTVA